jgi:hypothetical protein
VSKKRERTIRIEDLPQAQPQELAPEPAAEAKGGAVALRLNASGTEAASSPMDPLINTSG